MKNLTISFIVGLLLPNVGFCETTQSAVERAKREFQNIPKEEEILHELKRMHEAIEDGSQSVSEDEFLEHAEEIMEKLTQTKFTVGLRAKVLNAYVRSLKSEKAIDFLARYVFDSGQVESGEDMLAHMAWVGDGVSHFGTNAGIAIASLFSLNAPDFPKYSDFTSSELRKEACKK